MIVIAEEPHPPFILLGMIGSGSSPPPQPPRILYLRVRRPFLDDFLFEVFLLLLLLLLLLLTVERRRLGELRLTLLPNRLGREIPNKFIIQLREIIVNTMK